MLPSLLRNGGTLSLLFIDWVICVETEHIKGKIPFPYSGRDTEVLYVGQGIWRSGLPSCMVTAITQTETCGSAMEFPMDLRYYLLLFEGPFLITLRTWHSLTMVLESGYVAWNHLRAQLFSLSLIIFIQSFHHHEK